MEQLQSTGINQIQFKAAAQDAPVQVPQMQTVPPEIENGDEKSMDALKWAGIIGAGALAVGGGLLYAAKTGRLGKIKALSDIADISKFTGRANIKTKGADGKEIEAVGRYIKGVLVEENADGGKVRRLFNKKGGKIISETIVGDSETIVKCFDDNGVIRAIRKNGTEVKLDKDGVKLLTGEQQEAFLQKQLKAVEGYKADDTAGNEKIMQKLRGEFGLTEKVESTPKPTLTPVNNSQIVNIADEGYDFDMFET